jgi:hypothetical protein
MNRNPYENTGSQLPTPDMQRAAAYYAAEIAALERERDELRAMLWRVVREFDGTYYHIEMLLKHPAAPDKIVADLRRDVARMADLDRQVLCRARALLGQERDT